MEESRSAFKIVTGKPIGKVRLVRLDVNVSDYLLEVAGSIPGTSILNVY